MCSIIQSILILFVISNINSELSNICRLPDGKTGECIPIKECLPLYELSIYKDKTDDHITYLMQNVCAVSSKFVTKVCCPPESEWLRYEPPPPVRFPKPNSKNESETDIQVRERSGRLDNVGGPDDIEEFTREFFKNSGKCPLTLEPPDVKNFCCGIKADPELRIVGGKDSPVNEHPWLALLEYANGGLNCGGTLISSRYVLTAGHCVEKSKSGPVRKVRLSEYNVDTYPIDVMRSPLGKTTYVTVMIITVERQLRHPQYEQTSSTAYNDIGLVKLSKNTPYAKSIRPVCLPSVDPGGPIHKVENFAAVGWGKNGRGFNEIRQVVMLPYVDFDRCQEKNNHTLRDTQFCAGGEEGRDTCNGDSGGPLIIRDGILLTIAGIVSYGNLRCGTKGSPAIYTNVYKYIDWIKNETLI